MARLDLARVGPGSPPKTDRPLFDGMPDYQRHAGSNWDFGAATQFALMFFLGLRQDHYLLDIGCGSLRVGRLLMVYLLPGHYYGIEPHQWTIDVVLEEELGGDFLQKRQPTISNDDGFNLSSLDRRFDFILAHSIFTHAAPNQVRKCLVEAEKVLEHDGIFAATYSEGEEDYDGDGWAWPHCVAYRVATMLHLVEEAGLVAWHMDWPLFNPKGQHRLLLIAKPGAEDLLLDKIAARERGAVTTWAGPWTRC